jgi:hypothetical protein
MGMKVLVDLPAQFVHAVEAGSAWCGPRVANVMAPVVGFDQLRPFIQRALVTELDRARKTVQRLHHARPYGRVELS